MSKKTALIIGINSYKSFPLRGCVNDGEAMREILIEKYDFKGENIQFIKDESATSQAILDSLDLIAKNASDGDNIVFFFAGHGTQIPKFAEGEIDGKNEALVPYDMNINSLISDDVIYQKLLEPFSGRNNISVAAIFDCCHSGTILRDLGYDTLSGEPYFYAVNRCIPNFFLFDADLSRDVILNINGLSACQDDETAADLRYTPDGGVSRGAFSYSLHKIISSNPSITYGDLNNIIGSKIKEVSKHKQNPSFILPDPSKSIFS